MSSISDMNVVADDSYEMAMRIADSGLSIDTKLASILYDLYAMIKKGVSLMEKYNEDFSKDPMHALSWSNDVFEHSAKAKVACEFATRILSSENDIDLQISSMKEYCEYKLMSLAKYVSRSTSPTSNLCEEYTRAAYAVVFELLKK